MINPNLILLGVVVSILAFGVFFGFMRKSRRTVVRLITLLLSFAGAFVVVKLFGGIVGRAIVTVMQPLLGEGVGELLAQPEMVSVVDALCEMVAAPLLFPLVYFLLKTLSWILYKVIVVVFRIKGPKFIGRLSGAFMGLLCGLVGLTVFLVPVFGYVTFANSILESFEAQTEVAKVDEGAVQEETEVTLLDTLAQIGNVPVAKQCYDLVGRHVFRALTTVNFEDEKINLQEETSAVITVLKDVTVLGESSSEQYSMRQVSAIKQVVNDVGESKVISTVVAAFLSNAAESWLKGEEALGISKPDMGEEVQGVADAMFLVFSTTTHATVAQDLNTFADVLEILVDSNLFAMEADQEEFVKQLVSKGVVNRLYAVLEANPRMEPVKTAIRDTGVRVVMAHLGAPELLRETHAEMLEGMANVMKDSVNPDGTINQEALSTGIQNVMADHEVVVSEEASQLIAEAVTEYLTPEEIVTLSPEVIADKVAERFIASAA